MSEIKREGRELYWSGNDWSGNDLLATFSSIDDAGYIERIVELWNAADGKKLEDAVAAIINLPKTL
jgi:hypothetical protein